jgi:transcriptional regulator with XRE-family HTH domain
MKREKLIRSKNYIISQLQLNLLNLIGNYKNTNKLKDYQLAEKLNVSKGYISQVLNATYDHKISKVVDLSLACNAVPIIHFVDMEEYVKNDREDKVYELIPLIRPRSLTLKDMSTVENNYNPSYLRLKSDAKIKVQEALATN